MTALLTYTPGAGKAPIEWTTRRTVCPCCPPYDVPVTWRPAAFVLEHDLLAHRAIVEAHPLRSRVLSAVWWVGRIVGALALSDTVRAVALPGLMLVTGAVLAAAIGEPGPWALVAVLAALTGLSWRLRNE